MSAIKRVTKKSVANVSAIVESTSTNEKPNISKLISKIIKHFPKSIQTKLTNINKAGVEGPCTTKRVSQESRVSIPYGIISSFSLDQLKTYTNGLVIRLPFNEYETILNKTSRNELEEYLLNNIGGNKVVSCFICITKEDGYSGSSAQRSQYERLTEEIEKKNWEPIKKISGCKEVNKGNDKWSGHYYYNISGGQQECILSHPDKEDQIFTTYKGFMSNSKVIDDVKACLIYQLVHCYDIYDVIEHSELLKYKGELEEHLKKTYYMGKSCFELINNLGSIKKGVLVSPIRCEKLSIKMFEKEKAIDISHNEAVNKKKIYFCENNQILLSDYRPGNLFWDTHLGNMQQQEFTIEEYWEDHHRRSAMRGELLAD
jgi:hypothetical protein